MDSVRPEKRMSAMNEKNEISARSQRSRELLMERVCCFAREHLAEKITLKDVAGHCGVSVSTVTQLFQKNGTGTFHGYLTRLRMEQAADLIREGTALEEAGRRVGYTDHSSFYRAFRQTFGQSPREYRRAAVKK